VLLVHALDLFAKPGIDGFSAQLAIGGQQAALGRESLLNN
jgi:hypothetical protein